MNRYALIKYGAIQSVSYAEEAPVEDGYQICDITDIEAWPGYLYDGQSFYPPPELPKLITKVAFRFRMTDEEYVGILTAAKSDITVAAWVETFNMVSQIDLSNQRTKDGVALLVSKNLLTQVRATAVLTDPVQESERP